MSTELTQLFPRLRELKRAEKLYVIQFLVSELAQEETPLIQSGPPQKPFYVQTFDLGTDVIIDREELYVDRLS